MDLDDSEAVGVVEDLSSSEEEDSNSDIAPKLFDWGYIDLRGAPCLGVGAYGKVFGVRLDDEPFAIKRAKTKSKDAAKRMFQEFTYMRRYGAANAHLLRAFDYYYLPTDFFKFSMEFCSTNLEALLDKQQTVDTLRSVVACCLDGIQYLHAHSIIHRDLKPQNILLSHDNVWKVGDFGSARKVRAQMSSNRGTKFYRAPEMNGRGQYDKPVDVYAFGVVCAELIVNLHAFQKTQVWRLWRDSHVFKYNNATSTLGVNMLGAIRPFVLQDSSKRMSLDVLARTDIFSTSVPGLSTMSGDEDNFHFLQGIPFLYLVTECNYERQQVLDIVGRCEQLCVVLYDYSEYVCWNVPHDPALSRKAHRKKIRTQFPAIPNGAPYRPVPDGVK